MSGKYSIVYIAGMPHSGSTLLDLMISTHSQVFSVGEVFQLADYAHTRRTKNERTKLGNECTCGAETIWHCSFWPEVDKLIQKKSGMGLRDLRIQNPDSEIFRNHNKLLFDAVAEVSGARVIVDSSKLGRRLGNLMAANFAPITPIYLHRDPRGQIYSVIRRTHQRTLRPALRYCRETIQTASLLRRHPHISVVYEDVVRNPAEQMQKIMEGIGLPFESAQLDWHKPIRHNLSGNAMRKSSDSAIRVDEKWRSELGLGQKLAIMALTAPSVAMVRLAARNKQGSISSGGPMAPSAPLPSS
jgi:hypothetical protein